MSSPTPLPPLPHKSCLSCPSYLDSSATVAYFGKGANAPRCAAYGTFLGLPDASPQQAALSAEMAAKNCDGYGKPRPRSAPASPQMAVFLPDALAARFPALENDDPLKRSVRACIQCVNFVPDDVVARETGLSVGICRAKGTAVLSTERAQTARGCEIRRFGTNAQPTVLNLLPMPWIRPVVPTPPPAPTPVFIEPTDYPSDLPITDGDKGNGIQAWRRISDPDGYGEDTFLPVFDPDSFTEEERELIPRTGDDNHPESYIDHGGKLYQIAALWTEMDETPTLWGIPGCGKSEVCAHLAWMMSIPFYHFPINEATELDELAGRKEYTPELGTHFVEGRLTKAWPRRSLILVDEPNTGRNEVWTFLRPLITGQRMLTLDIDKGQRKKRGTYTFFAMAMNPAWSPLNVGTSVIGAADASRLMHIEFILPPEDIERRIIADRVRFDGWEIDEARLDFVIKVGTLLRGLCDDGTLSMTWAVRESIKVSRALRWFSPIKAFSVAGADYLEPEQRESFLDMVRSALPRTPFPKVEEITPDDPA